MPSAWSSARTRAAHVQHHVHAVAAVRRRGSPPSGRQRESPRWRPRRAARRGRASRRSRRARSPWRRLAWRAARRASRYPPRRPRPPPSRPPRRGRSSGGASAPSGPCSSRAAAWSSLTSSGSGTSHASGTATFCAYPPLPTIAATRRPSGVVPLISRAGDQRQGLLGEVVVPDRVRVREVHPGAGDVDHDLAVARLGIGNLDELEHLWAAELLDLNSLHPARICRSPPPTSGSSARSRFDSVRTPFGERERMLGGSAVHFALAASFFTEVRIVGTGRRRLRRRRRSRSSRTAG